MHRIGDRLTGCPEEIRRYVDLGDTRSDRGAKLLVGAARTAVQDQRDIDAGADLAQQVEVELGVAVVHPVRRTDGDRQHVHTGLGDEALDAVGIGEPLAQRAKALVLATAAHVTQLGLYADAHGVGRTHHSLGLRDILLQRQAGAVIHHVGEARGNRAHRQLKARAVIEHQRDRDLRLRRTYTDVGCKRDAIRPLQHARVECDHRRCIVRLQRLDHPLGALDIRRVEERQGITSDLCALDFLPN